MVTFLILIRISVRMLEERNKCSFLFLFVIIPVVSAGIACLANPCYHGICIDDLNSTYACYCTDGYTGIQCQTNWDECWSDPCQNGGTCIDGVASYNCSCPDGFIGDNCEINYNECESNPCLNNGTCIDMTNEYVCHCMPGFSGEHCENDVAVCNSTEEIRCYNGGECIEGPGFKFYCKCLEGWTGPKCEDQIDECESSPCKNGGICIDAHADYMCACTYGFTGKSCEVQIQFCDENSCSNGALCVVEDGERICYCVPDYHGERCEFQYDECLLGPRCLNGGTCIDGVDNFTCSCPPDLTGPLCECLILDDGTYDCEYVRTTIIPENTTYIGNTHIHDITTTEATYRNFTTEGFRSTTTTRFGTSDIFITTSSLGVNDVTQPESTTFTTITEPIQPKTIETDDQTKSNKTEPTMTSVANVEVTSESSTEAITTDISTATETTSTPSPTITEVATLITSENPLTTIQTTAESLPNTSDPVTEGTSGTTSEFTKHVQGEEKTSKSADSATTPFVTTSAIPILDTTTEKMFTDTPLDSTTSISTASSSVAPDTDTTKTMFDFSTDSYQTVPTDCDDSICNNHGTCHTGMHGIRCQCNFNYGGIHCEEKITIKSAAFDGNSYVVHRIRNSTSIDIEFSARTLISDGQIMHVDIARSVYMELYMKSGLLKFQFSCGYQTMLLGELKTYVNKGYPMKIETRLDLYMKEQLCNATIRLNDTLAMSGGQIANITTLHNNATVHFGNGFISNHSEKKQFVGCIKDLIINGESREVFGDAVDAVEVSECSSLSCLSSPCLNGGSCSDHDDTYVCSCANGWMGASCNQSVCEHNPCGGGGSCVRHPGSGFLCLCPYGRHGIFCEYNVEITRPSLAPIASGKSSYVIYGLSPNALNSDRFDLRLRFQTNDMDQIALLAFVGQNGRHDSKSQHLALTFVKGYIMLTWNMGSGPRRVFTARAIKRGAHTVRVWRRGRTAGLTVDARHNVTGNAPATRTNMTLTPYVYIGGHPSDGFHELPHDIPLHGGWSGCVWDVGGQSVSRVVAGRGVGQCGVSQCTPRSCNAPHGVCLHSPATYGCICNEGWFGPTCNSRQGQCDPKHSKCRGRCVITLDESECDCPYGKSGENCELDLIPLDMYFTGRRSYLTLHPRSLSSVSLSLEAEIKPIKERGLIIFVETPHFYTALSLQGGLLEYRWTDRLSGVSSVVRSGAVSALRAWHGVRAGRYGDRLYVWADGALATQPLRAHAYPHTASDATVVLGGAADLSTLPIDVMSGPPESYTGCIRNFHINNVPIPLEEQTIKDGQNVGACDGSVCGGAGSGARCRRGACAGAHCGPAPCYRGRCLCPATTAGERCLTHVNVSTPQFDGAAMLSLTRAARRSGQLAAAPARIAFNFTTAEPDGLLLWIKTGSKYFGLGLHNGYLQVAWTVGNSTVIRTKNEESRRDSQSSTLVQAGFLADGDWHDLMLDLNHNLTLTVDQLLYFDEEFHMDDKYKDYDIFLGGLNTDDFTVRRLFAQNFKGCIDQISTKEDVYLTDYSAVVSENIQSCQLFPTT
ncbi:protein eyes shut [Aricia agestis]|uniref:protein eyes shut n=1 Tax=Aricia agestis TaxID=91739 RepID=UPI001C2022A7|nr:protein eyes shut [Aricia agestis]